MNEGEFRANTQTDLHVPGNVVVIPKMNSRYVFCVTRELVALFTITKNNRETIKTPDSLFYADLDVFVK